jgi:isopentenyl-diphosphate delta-isomerase
MNDNATLIDSRRVILCDAKGRPTGTADILAAHTGEGMLHLAFSVFIFSSDRRRVLIQQRSREKVLWPLAWANTCCSHPREGETAVAAGQRRLQEEMGFSCELTLGPEFVYRALDPNGRGVEHEYDAILLGTYDGDPQPVPAEVAAWKWVELESLQRDMQAQPERYAPWFPIGLRFALAPRESET